MSARMVCLCGSMRFEELMRVAAVEESLAGRVVLMPHVNTKAIEWLDKAGADLVETGLSRLHLAQIRMADEVVVVSDSTGYVGDSTRREIRHAEAMGKPVRYWAPREAVA